MEFVSVQIQGSIVSTEILDRIRNEEEKYQSPSHFGSDGKGSIRDEIANAWSSARHQWRMFDNRRANFREGDTAVSETRNFWLIPFLGILKYDATKAPAFVDEATGKSYAISHRDDGRNGFPIHLVGIGESLDVRHANGGPRLSPHALVQEYLNHTEHTYAIVSNGALLRLLRDNSRLVRMSYLEFDLEKIMTEELYGDFALLYRLLHATRMPVRPDALEESYIEHYHQESLGSGARIRERLSHAVEQGIKLLGNAFLKPTANRQLRAAIDGGELTPDAYYLQLLRLIYRLLFLIVIEERQLVYPDKLPPEGRRLREIYERYYSLQRLRKLSSLRRYVDRRKHDLWQGLMATFRLFENGKYGMRLGIRPLGTGLWAEDVLAPLPDLLLPNGVLLDVLHRLSYFEDAQRQLVRVNYSDLDVEEFGSVYEGLLEYAPTFTGVNGSLEFGFEQGSARSSSGSHYTPEDLVKPLITHSLDHLIADRLKSADPEAGLLGLRVADIACGSGHILLSAARRIGFKLACLRETRASQARFMVEQPSPAYLRAAVRDVIGNCIHGVDKNPFAVELCKVALWLEAHNPGEPLGFLDHHVKCGDAIVGLVDPGDLDRGIATEAFATLHGDDKALAAQLRQQNRRERGTRGQQVLDFAGTQRQVLDDVRSAYRAVEAMPEGTPEEIAAKALRYRAWVDSPQYRRFKQLCDIQVAQFFIPKAAGSALVTDATYFRLLHGQADVSEEAAMATAQQVARQRFFHWFLEFPEVFSRGGFDCILGNPPFLGGSKISTHFGSGYLNHLLNFYPDSVGGTTDLVAYFFLRAVSLTRENHFVSLISANAIALGDTRRSSLEAISTIASIHYARKNVRWPGDAAVRVAIVGVYKGKWASECILNERLVSMIDAYLREGDEGIPLEIAFNKDLCFRGTTVLGAGFVLAQQEASEYLEMDSSHANVLFRYLIGRDLNQSPQQAPSRWIINFFDWSDSKCWREYPILMKRVETLVKPERSRSLMPHRVEYWWQFAGRSADLYERISRIEAMIACCMVGRHLVFSRIEIDGKLPVIEAGTAVFTFSQYSRFAELQSSLHNEWAWRYGSRMKTDLRYSINDCVRTFPFPRPTSAQESDLETLGEAYHQHRADLMVAMQLGLTKTYNLFHSSPLRVVSEDELGLDDKAFAKLVGKDALALRKHLDKTPGTITFNEVMEGIAQLRALHVEMDYAVAAAYGWDDIDLDLGFHEQDYLPEEDRVRFTLSPAARREVLSRLLALNHARHAEEVKAGLWEKGKATKRKG